MTSVRVNAPNSGTDGNPSAVALPGGRAVIAYQSRGEGEPFDILLRFREADGSFGPPIPLDAAGRVARMPDAALLSDGSLLISWLAETTVDGVARTNVLGQRVDLRGEALSDSFILSSRALSDGRYVDAHVEPRVEGGFVVQVVGDAPTIPWTTTEWGPSIIFPQDDSRRPEGQGREKLVPLAEDRTISFGDGFAYAERANGATDFVESNRNYYNLDWLSDVDFDGVDTQVYRVSTDRALMVVRDPIEGFEGYMQGYFDSFDLYWDYRLPATYSSLHAYLVDIEDRGRGVLVRFGPAIRLYDDLSKPAADDYSATPLSDGGFVAVWSEGGDIFAQLVGADRVQQGGNTVIAEGAAPQVRPTVTELADGDLLFAWQENRNGNIEVISREMPRDALTAEPYVQTPITQFHVEAILETADGEFFDVSEGERLEVTGRIESNADLAGFELQWYWGNSLEWTPIEGATGRGFTPSRDLVGTQVTLGATLTFDNGIVAETFIDPFEARWVKPDPAGAVEILGVRAAGQVLTADIYDGSGTLIDVEPAWSLADIEVQWFRDGVAIEGATDIAYLATDEDAGTRIDVTVVAQRPYDGPVDLTSEAVEIAAAPGDGEDLLRGGAGADRIDAGPGADRLIGGGGPDVFVFGRGYGAEVVEDFAPGTDRVEFAFDGIGGARALIRAAEIREDVEGVTLDLGEGDTLTLLGLGRAELSPADALFV